MTCALHVFRFVVVLYRNRNIATVCLSVYYCYYKLNVLITV